jgi:hypothetical protein
VLTSVRVFDIKASGKPSRFASVRANVRAYMLATTMYKTTSLNYSSSGSQVMLYIPTIK